MSKSLSRPSSMNVTNMISRRCFSTTMQPGLLKALGSTLKNTSPKNFEKKEVIKPVGQAQKPSSTDGIDTRSFKQRRTDWMNNDNRLKRKENLEKEFATSGMYDMFIFRKTGGKVFISPRSYFKKEKSLYFPNFIADENLEKGKNISTYDVFTNSGANDKFSIVRIFTTAIGQNFTKKYFDINKFSDLSLKNKEASDGAKNYLQSNETFQQLKTNYPNLQIVNVTLYDNFFKKWIFKTFASKAIKKNVSDPEYLKNFLILNKKYIDVPTKESINYLNGITGYIYIIDNEGKIRWLSCGDPEESDIQTLWKTVQGLQLEVGKKTSTKIF
ncbi:Atp10 protein [Saccharomycopsis crataegensis]|uniref:Atp10 protein n=1 Tax=Saccharomycopsis crataegensis TaxID=43959 RepID=A0AAV5QR54_9ASCO|nr:Atp10 protein [Saccharomycopsis crataegensis]